METTDTEIAPGIVTNPGRMGGRPTITGTRITVERVLSMLAGGYSLDDIQRAYPHLSREQIISAISYAEHLVRAQITLSPPDIDEMGGIVE